MRSVLRSLPWSLALLSCPVVTSAGLCRIEHLTDLEGEIVGRGGRAHNPSLPADGCAWHIRPGMWLRAIEFRTHGAEFAQGDQLSFYASAASRAGLVLRASSLNPLPESLVLTGSSEVLIVLSAHSTATNVRISYRCSPAGHRLGNLYLPPAIYVSLLAALAFLGLMVCLLPAYAICHCWAKRGLGPRPIRRPGRLLIEEELQDANSRTFQIEQRTVFTLEALPIKTWSQVDKAEEAGEVEECCFCLDCFKDSDQVKVLPCGHYFHKACVDRWFAARRYMPRSCPHCRRDPVADAPPTSPTCVVAPTSYGRAAEADGAASRTPSMAAEAPQVMLPGSIPDRALP